MTDVKDKSAGLMRVVVRLPPEEYNNLFRYVSEIGSTMSAFVRESVEKAMKEAGLHTVTKLSQTTE
jgi:predicted DNA-binding protein